MLAQILVCTADIIQGNRFPSSFSDSSFQLQRSVEVLQRFFWLAQVLMNETGSVQDVGFDFAIANSSD